MALLDFAVRPPEALPPLGQAFIINGRISSSVCYNTALSIVYHVYVFREWGMAGFLMVFAIQNLTVLLPDVLLSNSFGRNVENLRKAGFSDVCVLATIEFNLISVQLIGFIIVNYLATDPDVYTLEQVVHQSRSCWFYAQVIVNLLVAEALFTYGHSLTHIYPSLMQFHIMHHCSTYPTILSNLLFHPIDLFIEFTGPALGFLGLHFFVWKDQFTLLVTYLIFYIWCAYNHDENLNLCHKQHHELCNSHYAAFVEIRGRPEKNMLRHYMRKTMDLSWPLVVKHNTMDRTASRPQ